MVEIDPQIAIIGASPIPKPLQRKRPSTAKVVSLSPMKQVNKMQDQMLPGSPVHKHYVVPSQHALKTKPQCCLPRSMAQFAYRKRVLTNSQFQLFDFWRPGVESTKTTGQPTSIMPSVRTSFCNLNVELQEKQNQEKPNFYDTSYEEFYTEWDQDKIGIYQVHSPRRKLRAKKCYMTGFKKQDEEVKIKQKKTDKELNKNVKKTAFTGYEEMQDVPNKRVKYNIYHYVIYLYRFKSKSFNQSDLQILIFKKQYNVHGFFFEYTYQARLCLLFQFKIKMTNSGTYKELQGVVSKLSQSLEQSKDDLTPWVLRTTLQLANCLPNIGICGLYEKINDYLLAGHKLNNWNIEKINQFTLQRNQIQVKLDNLKLETMTSQLGQSSALEKQIISPRRGETSKLVISPRRSDMIQQRTAASPRRGQTSMNLAAGQPGSLENLQAIFDSLEKAINKHTKKRDINANIIGRIDTKIYEVTHDGFEQLNLLMREDKNNFEPTQMNYSLPTLESPRRDTRIYASKTKASTQMRSPISLARAHEIINRSPGQARFTNTYQ